MKHGSTIKETLEIQGDMDWLSEAVCQFYQVHLDRMIRMNDKLWGDFCQKGYVWNEAKQTWDEFLELNTTDYDLTGSTAVVPSIPKTVMPEPEIQFSFQRHSW